jgi:hypothetical protein
MFFYKALSDGAELRRASGIGSNCREGKPAMHCAVLSHQIGLKTEIFLNNIKTLNLLLRMSINCSNEDGERFSSLGLWQIAPENVYGTGIRARKRDT